MMEGGQVAPRKLADLFDPWMYLVTEELDARIRGLGEREPPPTLAEYQAEIDSLASAAAAVRGLCTNDVRTGVGGVFGVCV